MKLKFMTVCIAALLSTALYAQNATPGDTSVPKPKAEPHAPLLRIGSPGDVIVPKPKSLKVLDATGFTYRPAQTVISIVGDETKAVTTLAELLAARTGSKLGSSGAITLSVADIGETSDEAYTLKVDEKGVTIVGQGARGLAWGIQSFLQLLPATVTPPMSLAIVPAMEVKDAPEYAYRGMHLDVCRHFFTVAEVKKYIDLLEMFKLNTFHWHLTEDQGWRIEIKKYPKLTTIGAQRDETPKEWKRNQGDGKPYGPYFYTQEQIKEVVAYATARQIEVIPEIELPGHAQAALAGYPELGCTGGPYKPWTRWGVSPDVFCAGNDQTLQFLKDVFDEVVELFPSKYIHIGGDECPKDRWKKCAKCQARIKAEKLKDEHQLQSWFVTQFGKYLQSKGKEIIGWDEILEGGIPPGAIIMSWRGTQGGINAARAGHQVIMTPNGTNYFDYAQARGRGEPESIGGFVPIEKNYAMDVSSGLPPAQAKLIKGVQANMWSEYFHTTDIMFYHALPRMASLAEVGWTPYAVRKGNFNEFQYRLQYQYPRFDAMGVNYRFTALVMPESIDFESTTTLDFGKIPQIPYNDFAIHYKIDDGQPKLYTKPITIDKKCTVTYYATFRAAKNEGRRTSKEGTIRFNKIAPLEPRSTGKALNANEKEGLNCKMALGDFRLCGDVAAAQGKAVKNPSFDVNAPGAPQNNYGLIWEGSVYASSADAYTFSLQSDDGSMLWINGEIVVNHDGLHNNKEKKNGTVRLKEGWYDFKLAWFDAGEAKSLKPTFKIGKGKEQAFNPKMFKSSK